MNSKKINLNILAILEHLNYLTDYQVVFDGEIKIICPYHEEKVPSCSISLSSGLYHCFGCGRSGNIFNLISQTQKVGSLKAMQIAQKISNGVPVELNNNRNNIKEYNKEELYTRAKIFYEGLSTPSWDVIKHHYLVYRGFSTNTLKYFGVKINQSSLYPIIIPIYENTKFKGYILRRVDTEEPKYLYSRGFGKTRTLAGNIVLDEPVLVVEGILDMLKAWQFGFSNVCCTLGWSASSYQIEELNKIKGKIIIALDNDKPGEKGFLKIKNNINRKIIKFPYPKHRKDICEMGPREFTSSLMKCWKGGI